MKKSYSIFSLVSEQRTSGQAADMKNMALLVIKNNIVLIISINFPTSTECLWVFLCSMLSKDVQGQFIMVRQKALC